VVYSAEIMALMGLSGSGCVEKNWLANYFTNMLCWCVTVYVQEDFPIACAIWPSATPRIWRRNSTERLEFLLCCNNIFYPYFRVAFDDDNDDDEINRSTSNQIPQKV
jgi:hypothetical protein